MRCYYIISGYYTDKIHKNAKYNFRHSEMAIMTEYRPTKCKITLTSDIESGFLVFDQV